MNRIYALMALCAAMSLHALEIQPQPTSNEVPASATERPASERPNGLDAEQGAYVCGNHGPAHLAISASEVKRLTTERDCKKWAFKSSTKMDAKEKKAFKETLELKRAAGE